MHKVHFDDQIYEMEGSTVAELVEGLSKQLPDLQPDIHGRKVLQAVGFDTEESLFTELEPAQNIYLFPVLEGEKRGLTQILIGGALMAVGLGPVGAALGKIGSVAIGGYLAQMGFMMVLGGLAQMLAPVPENGDTDSKSSRYLGNPRNTVQIGTRIPVLYGEFRHGGHYLSFDMNASKG